MSQRDNRSSSRNNKNNNNPKSKSNRKPSSDQKKSAAGDERSSSNYKGKDMYNVYNKNRFAKRMKTPPKDDGTIRLNKYVANAGICSRREADELIATGVVTVNGEVITEMGFKVQPGDEVKFDGKKISAEKNVYFVLNKPKGYITTAKDEKDRDTVMDLMAGATPARIFPVGRLDRQTTGVLLFTNDGFLTKKLTHPSYDVKKIYHVTLDRKLTNQDLAEIKKGVRLIPEGVAIVDDISFIEGEPHNQVGIELHIGWNRVVRRIFEKLGYTVEKLDRVSFAGLTKSKIKKGEYRALTQQEINFLKMI